MKNGAQLSNHVEKILKSAKPHERAIENALSVAKGNHKYGVYFNGGVHSQVAGRTDHLPINVLAGSYVFPADIVSGLGEGNTAAGQKKISHMFGGSVVGKDVNTNMDVIPIIVAGGEYVLCPDDIKRLGGGEISKGHKLLDGFVVSQRKKLINTLKKLPGPKKD